MAHRQGMIESVSPASAAAIRARTRTAPGIDLGGHPQTAQVNAADLGAAVQAMKTTDGVVAAPGQGGCRRRVGRHVGRQTAAGAALSDAADAGPMTMRTQVGDPLDLIAARRLAAVRVPAPSVEPAQMTPTRKAAGDALAVTLARQVETLTAAGPAAAAEAPTPTKAKPVAAPLVAVGETRSPTGQKPAGAENPRVVNLRQAGVGLLAVVHEPLTRIRTAPVGARGPDGVLRTKRRKVDAH